MQKKIMHFKSLAEEMEFWNTHDATEFEAKEVTVDELFSELAQRQEMKQVRLRLEDGLINRLKAIAVDRQMSYSALVRELLWKEVEEIDCSH